MSGIQTKVAAGSTVLALGALAAFAVSSGGETQTDPAAATNAGEPEVRTQTVRRTIRVVRREKPRGGSGSGSTTGAAAPPPAPGASGGPGPSAGGTTTQSAAPASAPPVT
ncbi:MAG TPA: hypothetical protein VD866_20310, partial [Urbifossiella sp.]|nr:hypothetical protein [Urbifossiella sp.]